MTHPLVLEVRAALEKAADPVESAKNAGVHEVSDAVSRRLVA